jgi:hypothetical protein
MIVVTIIHINLNKTLRLWWGGGVKIVLFNHIVVLEIQIKLTISIFGLLMGT